jgi:hypothetical protein
MSSVPDDKTTSSSSTGAPTSSSDPDQASSTQSSTNVGAIAGGVVGGVAAVIIIALLIFFLRRRRRSHSGPRPLVNLNGQDEDDGMEEARHSTIAVASSAPTVTSPFIPTSTVPPSSQTGDVSSEDLTEGSAAAYTSLSEKGREARRRERQRQLETQMRKIQREINALNQEALVRRQSTMRTPGSGGAESQELKVEDLMSQLGEAQAHVAFLQQQQQSAWAMGLTDDPPPGYEAEPSEVSQHS